MLKFSEIDDQRTNPNRPGRPWSPDNVIPHPIRPEGNESPSAFAEECEAIRRANSEPEVVEEVTLDDSTLPRRGEADEFAPYWMLCDDGSLCVGSGDEMIRLDPALTLRLARTLSTGVLG